MNDSRIPNFTDGRHQSDSGQGRLFYWAGGAIFILFSIVIFLINTNLGIGILPDSIAYMRLNGLRHDAPLYPWLLQLTSLTGASLVHGAKAIGLIFVTANTALIWHLLVRATGKYGYAAVGTAIITLSPQFVSLHSTAMSEPPYLFLLLVTLLVLLHYLESEKRVWLITSAAALGVAALTRFTAPPFGAAVVLCLLLNPRHNLTRRFSDAAIFGLVSASIFLSWSVISQIVAGRSLGRELWFYGNMGINEWLSSLKTLTAWLLPDEVPFAGRVIAFGAFFLAAAWLTFAHAHETLRRARDVKAVDALLPTMLGLFFFCYMAFMVLATSIEANLSLNTRYAFSAYVTTVLMMAIVLAHFSDAKGSTRLLHRGLVVFAILVLGSHAIRTTVRSQEAYRSGIGYASLTWLNSPTIRFLRGLPAGASIYSNGQDVLSYFLNRRTNSIPEHVRPRTGVEDPANTYEMQLQSLRNDSAREGTYVVIFDKIDWRFYLATEVELKQRLSLIKVATESDGRVYVMPKTNQEE